MTFGWVMLEETPTREITQASHHQIQTFGILGKFIPEQTTYSKKFFPFTPCYEISVKATSNRCIILVGTRWQFTIYQ